MVRFIHVIIEVLECVIHCQNTDLEELSFSKPERGKLIRRLKIPTSTRTLSTHLIYTWNIYMKQNFKICTYNKYYVEISVEEPWMYVRSRFFSLWSRNFGININNDIHTRIWKRNRKKLCSIFLKLKIWICFHIWQRFVYLRPIPLPSKLLTIITFEVLEQSCKIHTKIWLYSTTLKTENTDGSFQ